MMRFVDECSYCSRWNYKLGEPIEPLSAEEARRQAVSRDLTFTVVAWRERRVIADMKVGPKTGWHQVHFHDDLGRVRLYFGFKRVAPGQLFLATVFHYEYPSDSTRTRSHAAIVEVQFGADGAVSRMETDVAGIGSKSDYAEMDVSLNYEPEPAFGDWDSLFRPDRDKTLGRPST